MSLEENIEENIQLINKYDIFESRFGVFKILDYDLNLDERKLKFKKYDRVLCEDCSQEIEKFSFVCYNCYNKETDCNERNRMNHGICKSCFTSSTSYGCSICNIFKTSDYDLNLEERKTDVNKKFRMKFGSNYGVFRTSDYNLEIDNNKKLHMKFGSIFGIFKTSDYNLNLEERRAKYRKFYGIVCEECNNEIDRLYIYCAYCYGYYKETDTNKKEHMILRLNFGIFETLDYNLNLEERSVKYGKFDGILCEECNKIWKEEEQNMGNLMAFYVKSAIKKLKNITIIALIVMIEKLILIKKGI
uniref:Uncharacterized protein n=1 Tax=Rhizophagus irregularis (strain DAOM 181602 / DAOM 197198 / MUCL 43194) TaxID=747089 RepID=U9TV78_RHIID